MARKFFPGAGGGMPPMVASTVFIFLAALAIYVAIEGGYVALDDPVALDIDIEAYAQPSPKSPVPVTVTVRLTNNQDVPVALEAANPCDVFRWIVLTPASEFVQSEAEPACALMLMRGQLDAGFHQEESFTLELDPGRVTPGDYQLLVRYWGYETREPFTVPGR